MSTDLKRKDLLKSLLKGGANEILKHQLKYGPDIYEIEDDEAEDEENYVEDEIDKQNKLLSKSLQKRRK